MPEESTFWNPYRHLPASTQLGRRPPSYHHDLSGHRGVLTCRLEAKTALMVADQNSRDPIKRFWRREVDDRPTIAGTSLKGALRALAEIAGQGCAVTDRSCCSDIRRLCATCRLFGMSTGNTAYRGHVSIGDAPLDLATAPHPNRWAVSWVLLSNPKPRHSAFYPGDVRSNRKHYHHQPACKAEPHGMPPGLDRQHMWQIQPAPAGACFDVKIRFLGLPDDLLDLLIYTLILERDLSVELSREKAAAAAQTLTGDLCNKLGYAKPLGLGSYQITITNARVGQYGRGSGALKALTGDDLTGWLAARTRAFTQDVSPRMQALRRSLIFDPNDTRTVRYPDRAWFNSNPTTPLRGA